MTKPFAIFLSFFMLFQSVNMDNNDLLKIPNLLQHLTTHLKNGDSIGDFISLHYGSLKDVHKNKHKEHKNLPFNQYSFDAHINNIVFISSTVFKLNITSKVVKKEIFYYEQSSINLFFNKIFQPPRLV